MFCQQQLSPLSSRNRHFGDDAHPLHKVSWKLTMTAIITKKVLSKNGENAHHCHLLSLRLSSFVNQSKSWNYHGIIVAEKNLKKSWNHSNHTVIICYLFMSADLQCWHHVAQAACCTSTTARSSSGSAAGRPGTESKVQVFLGGRPSLRKVSNTACQVWHVGANCPRCALTGAYPFQ